MQNVCLVLGIENGVNIFLNPFFLLFAFSRVSLGNTKFSILLLLLTYFLFSIYFKNQLKMMIFYWKYYLWSCYEYICHFKIFSSLCLKFWRFIQHFLVFLLLLSLVAGNITVLKQNRRKPYFSSFIVVDFLSILYPICFVYHFFFVFQHFLFNWVSQILWICDFILVCFVFAFCMPWKSHPVDKYTQEVV